MKIGFFGLGRMGANMVERLVKGGHTVIASNRSPGPIEEAAKKGAVPAKDIKELVTKLDTTPKVVWLMVPSGQVTEDKIWETAALLKEGDIIIDGGNSNFRDSMRRGAELKKKGIRFLDCGTSGGIWGLQVGYCMMAGGEPDAFKEIEPAVKTLAPPDGYLLCGPIGAGHFTKMVHNGVEYGMMQAYAEGFELLQACDFKPDLEKVAHLWMQGSVVRSWLLELAERAFAKDPGLATLEAYVDDSGEGRWTVLEAVNAGVPMPIIANSLFTRFYSRADNNFGLRVLAALRREFGGHPVKVTDQAKAAGVTGKAVFSPDAK